MVSIVKSWEDKACWKKATCKIIILLWLLWCKFSSGWQDPVCSQAQCVYHCLKSYSLKIERKGKNKRDWALTQQINRNQWRVRKSRKLRTTWPWISFLYRTTPVRVYFHHSLQQPCITASHLCSVFTASSPRTDIVMDYSVKLVFLIYRGL